MLNIQVMEIDVAKLKILLRISFLVELLKFKKNVHGQVSDDLKGEGLRIIIPSNIIVIYTRLEVLLG